VIDISITKENIWTDTGTYTVTTLRCKVPYRNVGTGTVPIQRNNVREKYVFYLENEERKRQL
jgi:hypothetical protein